MLRRDVDQAVDEAAAKLNQMAVPPVRRWVLEYVLWKDDNDPALQRVVEECRTYRPLTRLLEAQNPDGTWPIPASRRRAEGEGGPFGWTHITMVRNLYMLFEYWATRDMGHVENALETLLSWQDPEGFIRGPETDGVPRPYHDGLELGVLIKFGMKEDQRVQRLLDWIMSMQRHDCGWNVPYYQDLRYRPEFRYMSLDEFTRRIQEGKVPDHDHADYTDIPSCTWTTLGVLRGVSMHRAMNEQPRVRKAAEFILDRFFTRNYHPSFYQSGKNWTMLKFPTYYGSGLTALDTLVHMGFGPNDERMEKPIRWLLSSRSKDGLWHRSERPHPIDDQWISLVCLEILGHYRDMF